MNIRFVFCFLAFFCASDLIAQLLIPMDEFIGVNVRREDPLDKLGPFGFVREYHDWVLDEGFTGLNGIYETASPGYPNNLYKWNPSYQTQTYVQFDDFYEEIADDGIMISPCLFRSPPYIANIDLIPANPTTTDQLEQKPVYPGDDPTLPASYIAYADWLYHFAARYGTTQLSSAVTNQVIAPKLHPSQSVETGLGYAEYIESWNEQDKYWITEYPAAYFTPEEYAAMISAGFDGHMQTLGLVSDPDNPGNDISAVGIKNADPNMRMVMGGLTELDYEYFYDMVDWFDANRSSTATFGKYPFDVINFHHYPNDTDSGFQLGNIGKSPEEDRFKEQLLPIVAERDQAFPDVELWLTEFGYDTNEFSQQRVPLNGIGNSDQQEIQAQWILRSFMEIKAAGFDRASVFDLRDECSFGYCEGTFVSSGILMSKQYNYEPKKSWYYIYTMKNVLEGMVYDSELSPCQDTLCNVECPRVYKFTDPNDPGKKVYALWSPTSCDKPTYDYPLYLEGETDAQLITLSAPSTIGVSSDLTGTTVNVPVNERPVFVVVGAPDNNVDVPCIQNPVSSNSTCSTIKVDWDELPFGYELEIRYAPGTFDPTVNYNTFNASIAEQQWDASTGQYVITGLQANTDYTLIFTIGDGLGNFSDICFLHESTNTSTCHISIDPSWVIDATNSPPSTELIDEQNIVDPICGSGDPTTYWGRDYGLAPPVMITVDLQEFYYIDVIYAFDDTGIGAFQVEYALSPNGPWVPLTNYLTTAYKQWIPIKNLETSDVAARYLRFTADPQDQSSIGEVMLCGRTSSVNNNEQPPGPVSSFYTNSNSCNSIDLAWVAPLDNDINHYEITYTPNGPASPVSVNGTTTSIGGLDVETNYTFAITVVDNDGNESPTEDLSTATLTNSDCTVTSCNTSCPCSICLKESWILDMTPTSGLDPKKLVDEHDNINPICGTGGNPFTEWGQDWSPFNSVPPAIAILDLQQCYDISQLHLYDGNGIEIFKIEYQDQAGNWILFDDYETALYNQWKVYDNVNITARYLRFSKLANHAQINEIAICGTATNCNNTGCTTAGQSCDDGNACTTNDTYDANCVCTGISLPDGDADGVCDAEDNCPSVSNSNQADIDNDGIGDACDNCDGSQTGQSCDDGNPCTTNDTYDANCLCLGISLPDGDADGVCDAEDNCPAISNPNQQDSNNNGTGDACESTACDVTVASTITDVSCTGSSDGSIFVNANCTGTSTSSTSSSCSDNIALAGTATQSSLFGVASADLAIDDNTNGIWYLDYSIAGTNWEYNPWWEIDLGSVQDICDIEVYAREDCCQQFLDNHYIFVSDVPFSSTNVNSTLNQAGVDSYFTGAVTASPISTTVGRTGQYVRIQLQGAHLLQLAEVRILGGTGGGGSCNLTYNWDNGIGNINNPTNLAAGTYNLTITDETGCNTLETYTVNDCVMPSYCDAAGFQTQLDYIERISFAQIDNPSGDNDGYADFTSMVANVTTGDNFQLMLTPNNTTLTRYWRVWIDYNQDGDFADSGELAFENNSTNLIFGNITIPGTATTGLTRMRIAMRFGDYPEEPCGTFDYGEVEDYSVNIAVGNDFGNDGAQFIQPFTDLKIYPNPVQNAFTLSAPTLYGEQLSIVIYNNMGQQMFQKDFDEWMDPQSFDMSQFNNGVYHLEIRTENQIVDLKRFVLVK